MKLGKTDQRKLKKGQVLAIVSTWVADSTITVKKRKDSGRGFETAEITVKDLIDKYSAVSLYSDDIFKKNQN